MIFIKIVLWYSFDPLMNKPLYSKSWLSLVYCSDLFFVFSSQRLLKPLTLSRKLLKQSDWKWLLGKSWLECFICAARLGCQPLLSAPQASKSLLLERRRAAACFHQQRELCMFTELTSSASQVNHISALSRSVLRFLWIFNSLIATAAAARNSGVPCIHLFSAVSLKKGVWVGLTHWGLCLVWNYFLANWVVVWH